MRLSLYIGIGLLLCFGLLTKVHAQDNFRAMFYNVENLFDCYHDSLKDDLEYLPESIRAWHYGRYKHKINNIARVITAVGEWNPPALVGLCEVENEHVLKDLTKYSALKELGYRYIMTNSPDRRGIDVALLWQRGSFRMLGHHAIRVHFKKNNNKPTRDILWASGVIMTGDTLDVVVCHLPSRAGGEKESESARLSVAGILKQLADSLISVRLHPNILIMGDFNDYPQNASVSGILGAVIPHAPVRADSLYNLMADKKDGTYKYQGEWGILDHWIVSGYLLSKENAFYTSAKQAKVCKLSFLLEEDDKYGGKRPYRTYYGMKYIGGYSDHLPISLDFNLKE